MTSTGPTTLTGSEGVHLETVNGVRLYHNTVLNLLGNTTTINSSFANIVNSPIFMNRVIAASPYYQFSTSSAIWDAGPRLGGNYWVGFAANGDPSNGTTPFTGFNGTAGTDHYPYRDETYGMSYAVQAILPATGATVAAGSQKTISWNSIGCVYADIGYKRSGGSLTYIAQNLPDAGYYHWSVPGNLASGSDYQIEVDCKNSAQASTGTSSSTGVFTVANNQLILLSPNSDLMANSGSPIMVAWKKSAGSSISGVDVLYSADGSGYTLVASSVQVDYAQVTLPSLNSNRVTLLVRDSSNNGNADSGDGYFTVRGGTAKFTSPTASYLRLGTEVQVQWISPQNSAYVNLALVANGSATAVATNLADFGQYSWLCSRRFGQRGCAAAHIYELQQPGSGDGAERRVEYREPVAAHGGFHQPEFGHWRLAIVCRAVNDPAGAGAITTVYFSMNPTGGGTAACFVEFNRSTNGLRLNGNSGGWLGRSPWGLPRP